MTQRREFFEKGQPFHIISHATESKIIFKDETDCHRFIFQIYAANFGSPSTNLNRQDITEASQSLLNGEKISAKLITKEHPPLVYFLDFSLVANHYHFHLISADDNTIPLYMQKLNGGFGKYFNTKYKKRGPIFEGRYKSVRIETDFQSNAVSRYISIINPLDVYQPGWREKGLKNLKESFNFLNNYKFSSFPDKIGKRNSKILAPKKILNKYFPWTENKDNYANFVKNFLSQGLNDLSPFFLE